MPFRVLIVEDSAGPRGLLRMRLEEILRSDQLRNSSWPTDWPSPKSVAWEVDAVRPDELDRLITAHPVDQFKDEVRGLLKRREPDVTILDLALTKRETNALEAAGGTDLTGESDPTRALRRTTGFRILQVLRGACVVLISTYASNPRVSQACIEGGADSVITKPETDRRMNALYNVIADDHDFPRTVRELAKDLRIRADSYHLVLANEVKKAVKETALRRGCGHAPSPVPFWLSVERDMVNVTEVQESNLMLMDIRGFSRLVELGKACPSAVFEMMNVTWASVIDVLTRHDAEVNNFIGDAALVFRGVYSGRRAYISDTVTCGKELCQLFEAGGVARERLNAVIDNWYGTVRRQEVGDEMKELVSTPQFGLRVVVAAPDHDEALYGQVGTDRRWQHTILSRFMNWLARCETAVGRWEKEGAIDLEWSHGFLLWAKRRALPSVEGIRFIPARDYLQSTVSNDLRIRDVPDSMEIYKIADAEPPRVS